MYKREETEKIVEIIKQAGKIAMVYFTQLKDHHISTKGDGSLLTIADTEVDQYLRSSLEEAFPDYSVLSEESKNEKTTEGVFIIDPIDGTGNFASGSSNFAISIGLVINGKPEVGLVFAPAVNTLYVGEINGHAFCNDQIITVTNKDSLDNIKIFLHTGRSPETLERHSKIMAFLEPHNAIIEKDFSCASLDLCKVADGSYDAFVHRGLDAWDIAGAIAILQSAGGTVSHFDGSEKDLFKKNIVGTSPLLKDQLIAITKNC